MIKHKHVHHALTGFAMNKVLLSMLFVGFSSPAMSHGYVEDAGQGIASSRNALCKFPAHETGEKNLDCGSAEWEPQSLEAPDGFPFDGPEDGKIASAGLGNFSQLDEQTYDRWVKTPISSGHQTFKWHFTAKHVTKDWKYYLTKQDWNPNQPLARSSFDLEPFCVVDGNGAVPPTNMTHECEIPERDGYQVILAVWDIGDTDNAFYNAIDVNFEGGGELPEREWVQKGQIIPTQNLNVGDEVYTRVFDSTGENLSYSTRLTISSEQQGVANNWAHDLAKKVNSETDNIRSGEFDGENAFKPIYGINPVYLKEGSGLDRVEIGYDIEGPIPEYDLDIQGLEPEYNISDEPTEINLTLNATGNLTSELKVINHDKDTLASYTSEMKDGDFKEVNMKLSESKAGHHMLVSVIKDEDGQLIEQTSQDFHLVEQEVPGDYDFVFPESLSNYTEGTKVLASDGNVYQCKKFPYSGYCKQWTPSTTQFEPGTGSNWEMAWDKI
ncbi:N-acetylglucosamine-binding protein GbpA [Vibrio kanaloae]